MVIKTDSQTDACSLPISPGITLVCPMLVNVGETLMLKGHSSAAQHMFHMQKVLAPISDISG